MQKARRGAGFLHLVGLAVQTSNWRRRRLDRRALVLGIQWAQPIRKTSWLITARMKGDKGRGGPGPKPLKQMLETSAQPQNDNAARAYGSINSRNPSRANSSRIC